MTISQRLQQFWTEQIRLQELHIHRHDVSGRDALAAVARRERSRGPSKK